MKEIKVKRYVAYKHDESGTFTVPFYIKENAEKWCEENKDFRIKEVIETMKAFDKE